MQFPHGRFEQVGDGRCRTESLESGRTVAEISAVVSLRTGCPDGEGRFERISRCRRAGIAAVLAIDELGSDLRSPRVPKRRLAAVVENMLASIDNVSRLRPPISISSACSIIFTHLRARDGAHGPHGAAARRSGRRLCTPRRAASIRWRRCRVRRIAWEKLKSDIARFKGHMAEAIALSRRNEDVRARDVMLSLGDQFKGISNDHGDPRPPQSRTDLAGADCRFAPVQRSSTVFIVALLFLQGCCSRLIMQACMERRAWCCSIKMRCAAMRTLASKEQESRSRRLYRTGVTARSARTAGDRSVSRHYRSCGAANRGSASSNA